MTVGAAIAKAKPGDRILVRPGLYEESLVVDKPLEILGDGPLEDIEIRAYQTSALMFQASIGRVTNLTLRQTEGAQAYAVKIVQGRLELEGCDISSQSLAAVAIRDGADPRLRRNRIHGSKQAGVFVLDGGLGTLEDNEITGNAFAGVEIKSAGNPTLRRNEIHHNKQSGVLAHNSGLGTLEDNGITGNGHAGDEDHRGRQPDRPQQPDQRQRVPGRMDRRRWRRRLRGQRPDRQQEGRVGHRRGLRAEHDTQPQPGMNPARTTARAPTQRPRR